MTPCTTTATSALRTAGSSRSASMRSDTSTPLRWRALRHAAGPLTLWAALIQGSSPSSKADPGSDGAEAAVGWRRQHDSDRIARPYFAAGHHDAHDSGLADDVTVFVASQRGRHQTGVDPI